MYLSDFDDLPTDINKLCNRINYLFLHYADFNLYSFSVNQNRYAELNLRYLCKIIQKIFSYNKNSLNERRKIDNRILGICRDSALLLCSILRSRGIPARLRSGYINYFIPGFFLDGFCLEFYDSSLKRWRFVDTRTSEFQIQQYKLTIDFDLTDIPDDKFITAAKAWKMCREGRFDPNRFGSRQFFGLKTIRNRFIQDLALLNKYELLVWDLWKPMFDPIENQLAFLDSLSNDLISHAGEVEYLNGLYNFFPFLAPPDTVLVDNPFLSEYYEKLVLN
ncbi:MAG TPA: transglutaminase domain-containing protein [Rickettsiales bacterium]|nr:transglutaminase domain-containing protein [Rickettsiales bacterium]